MRSSEHMELTKQIAHLTHAINALREQRCIEFDWLKSHAGLATKQDLADSEQHILMKLSEIKAQVAAAATRSTEAFTELNTRVVELQTQIDALIVAASDPEVTDEAFLTDLTTIKTNTDALADIVKAPVAK